MHAGNLTIDMEQLGLELNQSGLTTYNTSMSEIDINMTELCTRDKEQRVVNYFYFIPSAKKADFLCFHAFKKNITDQKE